MLVVIGHNQMVVFLGNVDIIGLCYLWRENKIELKDENILNILFNNNCFIYSSNTRTDLNVD
jgi:hypothetical protein